MKRHKKAFDVLCLLICGLLFITPLGLKAQTKINYGDNIQNSISTVGEKDTFKFDGSTNEIITLLLGKSGGAALFIPRVEVYAPDGSLLAAAQGRNNFVPESRIDSLKLPQSGEYTLLLMDDNGQESGSYGFSLMRINPPMSNPINYGSTVQESIPAVAGVRTYTFTGAANEIITLLLGKSGGAALFIPRVEVYAPDGSLLAAAQGRNNFVPESRIDSLKLPQSGEYTLLLMDDNGQESGSYGFSLMRINPPMGLNGVKYSETIQGTIPSVAAIKAYTFTSKANHVVGLTFTRTSGVGLFRLRVEVYAPDGRLLHTAQMIGSNPVGQIDALPLPQSGEYTILVMDDNGQETGNYNLSITGPNFTPISFPTSDVRIYKVGTAAVPGRVLDYFIVVENIGNANIMNGYGLELLFPPSYFTFISADPVPDLVQKPFIFWRIPLIRPGEAKILRYSVLLRSTIEIGVNVVGAFGFDFTKEKLKERQQEVIKRWEKYPCIFLHEDSKEAFEKAKIWCPKALDHCIPEGQNLTFDVIECLLHAKECESHYETAAKHCTPTDPAPESGICQMVIPEYVAACNESVRPRDPNEKLVISKKYIQQNQTLIYPIHYENVGNIEARDVFITDTLDRNLDISTLKILTPGAVFDPSTRVLKWSLLNRNLPPRQTDNVLFSIKPLPNLASGTEIRNKASIQFEIFEIIQTNEVVNVIDALPPTSSMFPLPAEIMELEFKISWKGRDVIGEVDFYTILVSIDGGPFEPFISRTTDTSATYTGEVGKTYSFVSVATDQAGNVEVKEAFAEATIKLVAPAKFSLLQNYPNPFDNSTTIVYDLPKTERVSLTVYDATGRQVAVLANEKQGAGRHRLLWQPQTILTSGLYFYRLATESFSETKKMIFIRR